MLFGPGKIMMKKMKKNSTRGSERGLFHGCLVAVLYSATHSYGGNLLGAMNAVVIVTKTEDHCMDELL